MKDLKLIEHIKKRDDLLRLYKHAKEDLKRELLMDIDRQNVIIKSLEGKNAKFYMKSYKK